MSLVEELLKIPPVTRTLVGATLLITLPCLMGVLDFHLIFFTRYHVVQKFQIWRIFTSFFYGGKDFALIFDTIMLYRNSDMLEQKYYNRRSYDYAWQMSICCLSILLLNLPLGTFLHFRPLLACIIYLTCALDPNGSVSLFGLVSIPSKYFPYVLPAMDVLSGDPKGALRTFTGIIVGHLWWMMEYQHPDRGGSRYGRAPAWLMRFVGAGASEPPPTRPDGRTFGNAAAPRGRTLGDQKGPEPGTSSSAYGHSWGGGQRLGVRPGCG